MPEDEAPNEQSGAQAEAPEEKAGTSEEQEQSDAEKLKEVIDVQTESVGLLRTKITVTVPRDTVDERLHAQFDELRREAQVPGFRPGHAPMSLVEKRFGGEVKGELKDQLVAQAYMAAVEKQDLKVLGDPDMDLEKIELPESGDLSFSCEVELQPEFDLPKLEGIEIKRPKIEISDQDVTGQIDRMRAMRGNFEPVEGGEVEQDDLVVADLQIYVDSESVHREENAQVYARPSVIDGVPVESLGDVLEGSKAGDACTAEVELPDTYRLEEHRGKKARIELAVQEIKRLVLPELDQKMLADFGAESEEDLRTWIQANLEARLDQQVRSAMRDQLYRYLLDNTSFDVPPDLSQRQTERVVNRRMLELLNQGVPETEVNKQLDQLRTTAGEQAAQDLKLFFVFQKIAEHLEVDVSEEEINSRIAQIAQSYNRRFDRVRDDLMRRGGMSEIYVTLREQKCVDRLLEQANVVDAEPAAESGKKAKKASKPKRKSPGKKKDKELSEET
jgi:trigger factor